MAVLDRVPTDRVTAKARTITAARALLTLAAGILFGLGWLVAKVCAGAWFVLAWCFAAVQVGWHDARGRE